MIIDNMRVSIHRIDPATAGVNLPNLLIRERANQNYFGVCLEDLTSSDFNLLIYGNFTYGMTISTIAIGIPPTI